MKSPSPKRRALHPHPSACHGSKDCPQAPASWLRRSCIPGRMFSKRHPLPSRSGTCIHVRLWGLLGSPIFSNAHSLEVPLPTPARLPGACSAEGQNISLLCLRLLWPSWGTLARASFAIQTRWRMGEARTFLTSLPPLSTASDYHPRHQEL